MDCADNNNNSNGHITTLSYRTCNIAKTLDRRPFQTSLLTISLNGCQSAVFSRIGVYYRKATPKALAEAGHTNRIWASIGS